MWPTNELFFVLHTICVLCRQRLSPTPFDFLRSSIRTNIFKLPSPLKHRISDPVSWLPSPYAELERSVTRQLLKIQIDIQYEFTIFNICILWSALSLRSAVCYFESDATSSSQIAQETAYGKKSIGLKLSHTSSFCILFSFLVNSISNIVFPVTFPSRPL